MEVFRKHTISIANAMRGWRWAVKTQPNFRFHLLAAAAALAFSYHLGVSVVEVILVLVSISSVLITELINTALESATDLLTEGRWSNCARIAKDVSAAAVLASAFFATLVGLLIFLPRIIGSYYAS